MYYLGGVRVLIRGYLFTTAIIFSLYFILLAKK